MLHTLREPPAKGSLRESILIHYVVKQQHITFLRDLALAQFIVTKKYDIFEDLQKEMFPWIESAKGKDRINHIKKLMAEVQRGPLSVAAMAVPSVRSRLGQKAKRIKVTDETRKEQDDFYKKMGSMF